MLPVNGLFGWVSYNDRRSAVLFVAFVLAFHVLALLLLLIPLALYDYDHAPVMNWLGYGQRYAPFITLAGAGLFLGQLWWHETLVRRQSGFRYTHRRDEPRLYRITEPLVIMAGLPDPRLAIIESLALNAFACGLDKKSAVIVVTRGLLDALDDDELEAVIAHELAHFKNGDLRLIAAAAVCQRGITLLYEQGSWGDKKYQEAFALALSLFVLPSLFLLLIVISIVRQSAIHLSYITRVLISSAREFVADGDAIQLTKNPAALVSALRKIEGRSHVQDVPVEHEAMMIDGPSTGVFATHPTITDRVAAIMRVTGALATISAPRRDTRTPPRRVVASHSPWGSPVFAMRQKLVAATAEPRVSSIAVHSDRNILGFTPEMSVAAGLAIILFLGLNSKSLGNPSALAAQFDLSNFGLIARAVAPSSTVPKCNSVHARENCTEAEIVKEWAAFNGKDGADGRRMAQLMKLPEGLFALPGGTFSSVPPPAVKIETSRKQTCFIARYAVGDRGLHRIDEPDTGREISLSRYLGYIDKSLRHVTTGAFEHDATLKSYVTTRKLMIEVLHRFFGEPGLNLALEQYARPEHQDVVERIKVRFADPAFSKDIPVLEKVDYELLIRQPDQFISCVARQTRPLK